MIEFGTLTEQSVWEDNDVTPMIVVVVFENDRGCNHAVEKKRNKKGSPTMSTMLIWITELSFSLHYFLLQSDKCSKWEIVICPVA
jgi:hypothetical protein